MNILDFVDDEVKEPIFSGIQTIKEKIKQRRAQMLIHSCLYYDMDDSIVSDHCWQKWADELAELQTKYPECCNLDFYDKVFSNWDGSTGYHLPHRDPWVHGKAVYILRINRNDKE